MAHGRGCLVLAILLATVDVHFGGCMQIYTSGSLEGNQLRLICTVTHKKEEAEGLVVFLCKDRSRDCSPETSLQQMRQKRPNQTSEAGGKDEVSSQLVFTIERLTPTDIGTYQCAATSQAPHLLLQGRIFSISMTGTGNYTAPELKDARHSEFIHSTSGSGFLHHDKAWALLTTCLLVLQEHSSSPLHSKTSQTK